MEALYNNLKYLGHLFGIISLLMLSISIFFGGNSKILGKVIGLKKALKLHKILALISCFTLTLHPLFLIISSYFDKINIIDFFLLYISYLPFLLGIVSFVLFLATILITIYLKKIISHSIWINLHRVVIIAFVFSCIHQYNLGTLSGSYSENSIYKIIIAISIILVITTLLVRISAVLFKKIKSNSL